MAWMVTKKETLPDVQGVTSLWNGYTLVLGFLLVFRMQIAYARYWEGASILQDMRGVWMNAFSNLLAMSDNPARVDEVEAFQHVLVRLMSLMHCVALQEIAVMEDENFEVIDYSGIEPSRLIVLNQMAARGSDRVEILMNWIQRLIVANQRSGVIDIAPPILSRVFQELSNGIRNFQNAKKIAEFPFPFPMNQLLAAMLIIHWLITPIMCALWVESLFAAVSVNFITVFSMWGATYIAAELELPYGDDPNDLPMSDLQVSFNECLKRLMNPDVQRPPHFDYDRAWHSQMAVMTLNDQTVLDHEATPGKRQGPLHISPRKSERKRQVSLHISPCKSEMILTPSQRFTYSAYRCDGLDSTRNPKLSLRGHGSVSIRANVPCTQADCEHEGIPGGDSTSRLSTMSAESNAEDVLNCCVEASCFELKSMGWAPSGQVVLPPLPSGQGVLPPRVNSISNHPRSKVMRSDTWANDNVSGDSSTGARLALTLDVDETRLSTSPNAVRSCPARRPDIETKEEARLE